MLVEVYDRVSGVIRPGFPALRDRVHPRYTTGFPTGVQGDEVPARLRLVVPLPPQQPGPDTSADKIGDPPRRIPPGDLEQPCNGGVRRVGPPIPPRAHVGVDPEELSAAELREGGNGPEGDPSARPAPERKVGQGVSD